jgi:glycosyltransferase involved in cell wall biosynthesis
LRDDVGFDIPDDVTVTAFDYHRPWHLPRTVSKLRALIEETRPDVVVSNITATNIVTGMALARCQHRPAWVARIGNDPKRHDGPIRSSLAKRVYPQADRFVVNSRGLHEAVEDRYPCSRGRIDYLPNPTDFAQIEQDAKSGVETDLEPSVPLCVAVGRLFKQKRYDVMLDAFAEVRAAMPAQLWICGEGPERAALEKRIRRLDLQDSVKLLGFLPNPHAVVARATLFLMSSDHEGSPNALIEAQGLGIPAVSTNCPYGPDEIIEDQTTGCLVPVGDSSSLAEAAVDLLNAPERLEQMSVAARRTARSRFDAIQVTRTWQDFLRGRVCGDKDQPLDVDDNNSHRIPQERFYA